MKYNIYYQSKAVCDVQGGVSDFMVIEKDDFIDVLELAYCQGRTLSNKLNERIACVVCDEADIVKRYFQANGNDITCPAYSNNAFYGNRAMLDDDGRFYIGCS